MPRTPAPQGWEQGSVHCSCSPTGPAGATHSAGGWRGSEDPLHLLGPRPPQSPAWHADSWAVGATSVVPSLRTPAPSCPPSATPFPHAGHGVSPTPAGRLLPPRQLPGAGPVLGPCVRPLRTAPALTVQVTEHAVVDLAGDPLLLQHLLDGLTGRAGLNWLPALAGLLGLEGTHQSCPPWPQLVPSNP